MKLIFTILRFQYISIFTISVYLFFSLTLFAQAKSTNKLEFHNIQPHINTEGSEFSPTISSDGKTMIFNKKSQRNKYSNLFSSSFVNGQWQKATPMYTLNSKYSDEAPFLSADGKVLFFSSDRDGSMTMPKNMKGQIKVSYDLYWSHKTTTGWSSPKKLPGYVNSMHHERSPSYDNKRNMLFFSRWPFGNIKKSKIMASRWINNSFEKPVALPQSINSGNMEAGFMPAGNGKGYYFASKRAGGMGGWDIYYTAWNSKGYKAPVNMGPQVNSIRNEIYLISRSNTVLLCSNRKESLGKYDIFSTHLPINVTFKIINKQTNKPIPALAKITYNKEQNKFQSTINGIFSVAITNPNEKKLQVQILEKGYLPFRGTYYPSSKDIQLLKLSPIEKNKSFTLNNIHFDYNSDVIKPESFAILTQLSKYLEKNINLKLEIIGHTDRHASKKYNNILSLNRAKSVKRYLVKSGLLSSRFSVKGAGFSRPVSTDQSKKADKTNRRTEFKILNTGVPSIK